MKLKKGIKIVLVIILLILLGIVGFQVYKHYGKKSTVSEVKIINQIENYNYTLKETKPSKYKELFKELETILNSEEIDEEKYVSKISEMFIYDFYSLQDKTAKTDIGGVDFVYKDILENFLQNAQDTYYKYVESNIYNERKQSLQVVSNITIDSIEKKTFTYQDKTDQSAYEVKASWSYTDDQFSNYQRKATLIFIHDNNKLSLVELQNN